MINYYVLISSLFSPFFLVSFEQLSGRIFQKVLRDSDTIRVHSTILKFHYIFCNSNS
uniref:Uncharacterized protein n=1 Tax=Solanum lycopersicum TaxID=4081 RepID=A0A3Q7FI30_SOLLC